MKWLALALSGPLVLLAGGLLLNRPPLLSAPGLAERLKAYFTTNVAETRPDHRFPELRTPFVAMDVGAARTAVLGAMRGLGWQAVGGSMAEARAVVVSPLFRFSDDVTVRFEGMDGGTLLHVRSASRVGKGDLGANARHLRDLFAAIGYPAAPR